MKKKLVAVVLCMCALLLVGCNGESVKTLTCTSTEGALTEEMTFTFENDSISKVKVVYTSAQGSASDAESKKDALRTLITSTYGTPEYANYELNVVVSGSNVVGTLNIDYSKAGDTLKTALSSSTTYDGVKSEYQASGSTCR